MNEDDGVAIDLEHYVDPKTNVPHHLMMGEDKKLHILCKNCVGKVKGKIFGISSDKCEICGVEFVYGYDKPVQLEFF